MRYWPELSIITADRCNFSTKITRWSNHFERTINKDTKNKNVYVLIPPNTFSPSIYPFIFLSIFSFKNNNHYVHPQYLKPYFENEHRLIDAHRLDLKINKILWKDIKEQRKLWILICIVKVYNMFMRLKW